LTVAGGLSAGMHALKVTYSGDSTYAASSIAPTINVFNDSLSISRPSQALIGAAYTVGVAIKSASLTSTPGGTLTLSEGSVVLGTLDLSTASPVNGYYQLTAASGLSGGSHVLKVLYSGDGTYTATSSSFSVTGVIPLSTSISASYSTSTTAGSAYTVNAGISGSVAPNVPRTGTLSLVDGDTILATVDIATATPNSSGYYALTATGLEVGSHTLEVVYSGDTNYAAASRTLSTLNVKQISSSVSYSYSTPQAGSPLTINAKVNGTTLADPPRTGTLTLSEGSTVLATVDITTAAPNSSGYYALSVAGGLSAGSHSLKITYSGDATYAGATASPTLNILNDSLGLSYSSQALIGAQYTVGVAIKSSSLTSVPGGTLTLTEGTTVLGTLDLTTATPVNGYYRITTTSAVTAGSH
jgi:hypothetical protein